MIPLLKVEVTRLRWRRAVLLITLAAVAFPVFVFGAVAWNTRPISDGERQEIEQQVAEEREQPYVARELRRCVERPARYGVREGEDVQATCESYVLPQFEWYAQRSALDLGEEDEGSALVLIVVLGILMLLVGTTFAGHDWHSGSMSNQLLFQPRRARVWAAKGLVVLCFGLLLAGIVLAAYWGGLYALAAVRDLPVADGQVADGFAQAFRGTLLAAGAGLGGFALTMLFRSTVATLGVLFAVSIAGPLVISLVAFPGHLRALPQNNGLAVVGSGFVAVDETREECYERPRRTPGCVAEISTADGALYFGGLLLLAGVPSVLLFRRRDVP